MYLRPKEWITAISPTAHTEAGWENTFTIEESDAIDVRFVLTGYGWKPSATDENLQVLEKGSYKIYYRIDGAPTWTFLMRVESNRAASDVATVYQSVGCALGVVPPGKYQFKIVADKGSKFAVWGGAIEGIASGDKFWSNLQVRVRAYQILDTSDPVVISENVGVQLV